MPYSKRQLHYVNIFMQHIEIVIALMGKPKSLPLDEAIEQASSATSTADSVMSDVSTVLSIFGIAAAVPTMGASIPIANLAMTLIKGAKTIYNLTQGEPTDHFSVDDFETAGKQLELQILCRDVAFGAATRYRYLLEKVATPVGVATCARYAAGRMLKEVYPLCANASALPNAATLLDHLSESTHYARGDFATESKPATTKWAYSRPRVASVTFSAQNIPQWNFYKTTSEASGGRTVFFQDRDTTMEQFGYMVLLPPSLDPYINKRQATTPMLLSAAELQEVQPYLSFTFHVTRQHVEDYLTTIRAAPTPDPMSLNAYLSQRFQMENVIAVCHDNCLEGLDLSGGNFSDVDFRRAILRECLLVNTSWTDAHLDYASFGSTARDILLSNNDPESKASFERVTAEKSQWERVIFAKADFSYALMNGACLEKCNLQEANTTNCLWQLAEFKEMRLEGSFFKLLKIEHQDRLKAEAQIIDDIKALSDRIDAQGRRMGALEKEVDDNNDILRALEDALKTTNSTHQTFAKTITDEIASLRGNQILLGKQLKDEIAKHALKIKNLEQDLSATKDYLLKTLPEKMITLYLQILPSEPLTTQIDIFPRMLKVCIERGNYAELDNAMELMLEILEQPALYKKYAQEPQIIAQSILQLFNDKGWFLSQERLPTFLACFQHVLLLNLNAFEENLLASERDNPLFLPVKAFCVSGLESRKGEGNHPENLKLAYYCITTGHSLVLKPQTIASCAADEPAKSPWAILLAIVHKALLRLDTTRQSLTSLNIAELNNALMIDLQKTIELAQAGIEENDWEFTYGVYQLFSAFFKRSNHPLIQKELLRFFKVEASKIEKPRSFLAITTHKHPPEYRWQKYTALIDALEPLIAFFFTLDHDGTLDQLREILDIIELQIVPLDYAPIMKARIMQLKDKIHQCFPREARCRPPMQPSNVASSKEAVPAVNAQPNFLFLSNAFDGSKDLDEWLFHENGTWLAQSWDKIQLHSENLVKDSDKLTGLKTILTEQTVHFDKLVKWMKAHESLLQYYLSNAYHKLIKHWLNEPSEKAHQHIFVNTMNTLIMKVNQECGMFKLFLHEKQKVYQHFVQWSVLHETHALFIESQRQRTSLTHARQAAASMQTDCLAVWRRKLSVAIQLQITSFLAACGQTPCEMSLIGFGVLAPREGASFDSIGYGLILETPWEELNTTARAYFTALMQQLYYFIQSVNDGSVLPVRIVCIAGLAGSVIKEMNGSKETLCEDDFQKARSLFYATEIYTTNASLFQTFRNELPNEEPWFLRLKYLDPDLIQEFLTSGVLGKSRPTPEKEALFATLVHMNTIFSGLRRWLGGEFKIEQKFISGLGKLVLFARHEQKRQIIDVLLKALENPETAVLAGVELEDIYPLLTERCREEIVAAVNKITKGDFIVLRAYFRLALTIKVSPIVVSRMLDMCVQKLSTQEERLDFIKELKQKNERDEHELYHGIFSQKLEALNAPLGYASSFSNAFFTLASGTGSALRYTGAVVLNAGIAVTGATMSRAEINTELSELFNTLLSREGLTKHELKKMFKQLEEATGREQQIAITVAIVRAAKHVEPETLLAANSLLVKLYPEIIADDIKVIINQMLELLKDCPPALAECFQNFACSQLHNLCTLAPQASCQQLVFEELLHQEEHIDDLTVRLIVCDTLSKFGLLQACKQLNKHCDQLIVAIDGLSHESFEVNRMYRSLIDIAVHFIQTLPRNVPNNTSYQPPVLSTHPNATFTLNLQATAAPHSQQANQGLAS